ncbi:hypothetical protein [Flavisolibacter tropicus]|uniref:DUF4468 domain-containing protein n=1 Tax=Flavisolibacter tropicus TaxID=1492898 RepID=A0A172TTQ2_9BACT|nr:hypothetical protein [Flavisolibacter tropicus]ANE50410.1 hypothetical protein SY85_07790 [Flavisolibacter tropicus]
MQKIKKLIGCLILFVAHNAANGQRNITESTIDSIVAIIDTSIPKLALTTNPPKEGYLLSRAEYYIDSQGSLCKVVFMYGSHPGRVNGHLIYRSTYFYYNDEPLKAVATTINFKDTTLRSTYYFNQQAASIKSNRSSSSQIQTAKSFLRTYHFTISPKGY